MITVKGVCKTLPMQRGNIEAVENLLPYRQRLFDGAQFRRGTCRAVLKPRETSFRIGRESLTPSRTRFRTASDTSTPFRQRFRICRPVFEPSKRCFRTGRDFFTPLKWDFRISYTF